MKGSLLVLALTLGPALASADVVDGLTFAGGSTLFVPLREAADALGLTVQYADGTAQIGEVKFGPLDNRLYDGTSIIGVRGLEKLGASVSYDTAAKRATVRLQNRTLEVRNGTKWVHIDKSQQRLRAYQGERVVMASDISTGAKGHETPNGTFKSGPYKAVMHRSSLYDDAPMPWSVQIVGNIFVHGYQSVPDRPASHGCIRLPLDGFNPAKWFYGWIDKGTIVKIVGKFD